MEIVTRYFPNSKTFPFNHKKFISSFTALLFPTIQRLALDKFCIFHGNRRTIYKCSPKTHAESIVRLRQAAFTKSPAAQCTKRRKPPENVFRRRQPDSIYFSQSRTAHWHTPAYCLFQAYSFRIPGTFPWKASATT